MCSNIRTKFGGPESRSVQSVSLLLLSDINFELVALGLIFSPIEQAFELLSFRAFVYRASLGSVENALNETFFEIRLFTLALIFA